jgi:hypothetical protein
VDLFAGIAVLVAGVWLLAYSGTPEYATFGVVLIVVAVAGLGASALIRHRRARSRSGRGGVR